MAPMVHELNQKGHAKVAMSDVAETKKLLGEFGGHGSQALAAAVKDMQAALDQADFLGSLGVTAAP